MVVNIYALIGVTINREHILPLKGSLAPKSLRTAGLKDPPWCPAIQLPFFSFCDCNKSTLRNGHPEFCVLLCYGYHYCCYFCCSCWCFSQCRWLFKCKKKKTIWWKWKWKKNLNIWIEGGSSCCLIWTWTHTSLLYYHHTVICSLLHSHTKAGGSGQTCPYLLSAFCLRSCREKGHLISFLGDSFSWKRNLYNSCKAFWEG